MLRTLDGPLDDAFVWKGTAHVDDIVPRAESRNPPIIMSQAEAKRLGLKKYYTGKPCSHGHLSERFTTCWGCIECVAFRGRRWSAEHPQESKQFGLKKNLKRKDKEIAAGWHVYFLRHPETRVVFYIGSSRLGQRHNMHLGTARRQWAIDNALKQAVIRYIQLALGKEPLFEKVIVGLPKEEARELEYMMLDKIGTIADGTGPLTNILGVKVLKNCNAIYVLFGVPYERKTHCCNGHEFTAENTGLYKGRRYCRTCKRRITARWDATKKAGME